MRGHITHSLLLGILLCASISAHAAFITDKIVVEVRSESFGQGTVLKKLPSGTAVDVLMNDGQYTRIRTADDITGWVASTFLTNEKPVQLEYLELLAKTKTLEADLKAAQENLSAAPAPAAPALGTEELAELQQRAKDAAWMRVELKKARDRAEELEAQMNAKVKSTTGSQQELDKLRTDYKMLEERLAAALLVNQTQQAENDTDETIDTASASTTETENPGTLPESGNGWSVHVEWFLGGLTAALIAGFVAGITWLDKRIRRRHGGFRLY